VTGFVRRLKAYTSGDRLELSAAAFPDVPACITQQGQDWPLWAEQRLVDFMFPMNYTASLRAAATRTVCHAALVAGRVPMWEGLCKASSQARVSPARLEAQIRAVLDVGAQGIVLFSYASLTEADYEVVRRLKKG
jgi:uncharacterized lipoprotein YddW (UPF0748 family)